MHSSTHTEHGRRKNVMTSWNFAGTIARTLTRCLIGRLVSVSNLMGSALQDEDHNKRLRAES